MKILITGGAGFIGSHIVDAYIEAGHEVVIIDNLSTGSKKNINPKARLYEADILDLDALREVFQKEQPEVVNHHAAIAAVGASLRDPIPTIETNVLGTTNICLCANEFGVKRLLFASTGGVMYGDPKKLPVSESAPRDPISPYALSKALAEDVIRFYAKMGSFTYFGFRYANAYGPRQDPKGEAGIVAIFSELIQDGKQPTIFGDGSKTRDYVHVSDIVSANLLALTKGKNDVANIGWGKEVSDKEIFQIIADVLDYKKEPTYAPFRKGEVMHISLDSSKAKKLLNWEPVIKLEEGVRRTLTTHE
ncbi:UDP-glucose 4-epimerase [bacterium]|nr:UDP-glucose 4-epimerase [bacterium]|tara:strand:+ start:2424 stop:3338 length:915 start_codon:yes stop_codon:yes gene_type:complete